MSEESRELRMRCLSMAKNALAGTGSKDEESILSLSKKYYDWIVESDDAPVFNSPVQDLKPYETHTIEVVPPSTKGGGVYHGVLLYVTRVPYGWIYTSSSGGSIAFVPCRVEDLIEV